MVPTMADIDFPTRSPQWLDARTLTMHRRIVDKIRAEPALFAIVRDNLERWRGQVTPGTQIYLDAWQALVDQGIDACLGMALERSERGYAMRQSSPFAGVLTNKERWEVLRQFNQSHETR